MDAYYASDASLWRPHRASARQRSVPQRQQADRAHQPESSGL